MDEKNKHLVGVLQKKQGMHGALWSVQIELFFPSGMGPLPVPHFLVTRGQHLVLNSVSG